MESPKHKETALLDQSEEIIQEEPQEEIEGSPSIGTKRINKLLLSSTSVSSTSSSRSHSLNRSQIDATNTVYPNMVWHPLRTNCNRRRSLPMTHKVLAVQEEEATEEIDETKVLKLKQFKSLRDYGEFSTVDTRRSTFDRSQYEPRARSFDKSDLPLEKVQEVKNEEDRFVSHFLVERRWMGLKDCNEFNSKELNRKSKDKLPFDADCLGFEHKSISEKKPSNFSLSFDEDFIPEEETKEIRGRQGHLHPMYIPSPKMNKLKVDEIDFERKKSEFEQYQPGIDEDEERLTTNDVIKEDASEYGPNQQVEELLEKAKQKMTGEKEFLKKFLRSESSNEMDTMRTTIEREQSYSHSKIDNVTIDEENEPQDEMKL